MKVITARNVNDAFVKGCVLLAEFGEPAQSRAGDVLEAPFPVTTVYEQPHERVLFDARRDCNPYFHLMESLWMLAGHNDVAFVRQFNNRMQEYSDNKVFFHGAYGHRWRRAFGFDQLVYVTELLKKDPNTRRAILQMYTAGLDTQMVEKGLDIPCNLMIKFEARKGILEMQVFNRSNDIIFGTYGANAVHLSYLQEYVAAMIGLPMGKYWQISGNFHAYTKVWKEKSVLDDDGFESEKTKCPYGKEEVKSYPLVNNPLTFDRELAKFFTTDDVKSTWTNPFFPLVAYPMYFSWQAYKKDDLDGALKLAATIEATDWRKACVEWMERRIAKRELDQSMPRIKP